MNNPRTVAVDLDEVLGAFILPLSAFHNEEYGTKLSVADFHSYTFAEVWGGSREESTEKVHKFFESRHFEDIPCIPGALAAVKTLQENGFDLVVITSRQHAIEEQTRAWIQRHYPNIFRDIAFGNHWGLEGKKVSKPEMCASLGCTVLIDDSLQYTRQAAAAGIQSILFDLDGGYGWNKSGEDGKNVEGITRVHGWDEVVKILLNQK